MKIQSSAFSNGGDIPTKYTCDGQNISPPLEFIGVPDHTKSLALIVDDPDAPAGIWVHWVAYNLPPSLRILPENMPKIERLPDGSLQGKNDFHKIGYGGPCPPAGGAHRYFFKLYALDRLLDAPPSLTKEGLTAKIKGHILAEAEWMGKYRRR